MTGMLERIERHIRERGLIEPGGEVTCLVSGGADSTCLWHALGALGYRVSAVHVDHRLRGDESDEDARLCREAFGAAVLDGRSGERRPSEAALRELRYRLTHGRGLRATGHTASDQVAASSRLTFEGIGQVKLKGFDQPRQLCRATGFVK